VNDKIVGLGLVLTCVIFEAGAQICLKQSSKSKNRFWVLPAILLFVIPVAIYTWALSILPVSVAFPLGSLTLVFVVGFSRLLFYERINRIRWTGIALIVLGIILIAF
jgi:undecaprenyl phosphate-alpha-L-ara4N flippase subunit ArnE